MFDIAWTELLLVAVVAILVVGPKELPGMLRTIGRAIGGLRRMASDFQSTVNEAVKEAEQQAGIDEMRKQADAAQNFNPLGDLKKSLEEEKQKLQLDLAKQDDALKKAQSETSAEKTEASEPAPVKAETPQKTVVSSEELAAKQAPKPASEAPASDKSEG